MKLLLFALLVLFSLPVQPRNAGLDNGLIAYYNFNKQLLNAAGTGYNCKSAETVYTKDRFGIENNAVSINAKRIIECKDLNIGPDVFGDITIALWVKPVKSKYMSIVTTDKTGFGRAIVVDYRGGGWGYSVFAGSVRVLGHVPVTANVWTLLVAAYSRDLQFVTLHVKNSHTDTLLTGKGVVPPGLKSTYFGGDPNRFDMAYEGDMDDIRIYTRVLNDKEIAALYDLKDESVLTPTNSTPPKENNLYKGSVDPKLNPEKQKDNPPPIKDVKLDKGNGNLNPEKEIDSPALPKDVNLSKDNVDREGNLKKPPVESGNPPKIIRSGHSTQKTDKIVLTELTAIGFDGIKSCKIMDAEISALGKTATKDNVQQVQQKILAIQKKQDDLGAETIAKMNSVIKKEPLYIQFDITDSEPNYDITSIIIKEAQYQGSCRINILCEMTFRSEKKTVVVKVFGELKNVEYGQRDVTCSSIDENGKSFTRGTLILNRETIQAGKMTFGMPLDELSKTQKLVFDKSWWSGNF